MNPVHNSDVQNYSLFSTCKHNVYFQPRNFTSATLVFPSYIVIVVGVVAKGNTDACGKSIPSHMLTHIGWQG
jgi:hypothetical protein